MTCRAPHATLVFCTVSKSATTLICLCLAHHITTTTTKSDEALIEPLQPQQFLYCRTRHNKGGDVQSVQRCSFMWIMTTITKHEPLKPSVSLSEVLTSSRARPLTHIPLQPHRLLLWKEVNEATCLLWLGCWRWWGGSTNYKKTNTELATEC